MGKEAEAAMFAPLSPPRSNPPVAPERTKRWGERELLVGLALFWVVSLIRVVGGVVRHEVFGAEATLALMAVLGLPWLVLGRRDHSAR